MNQLISLRFQRFACLFLYFCVSSAASSKPIGLNKTEIIREREEWFNEKRRLADGTLPSLLRMKAALQTNELLKRVEEGSDSATAGVRSAVWRMIGPRPMSFGTSLFSGRVSAMAVDPRDPDTVYLGAAAGGVWKTINGGSTWIPLTDDQPSLAVGTIVLDPSDPDTVYVGTGEQNFSGDQYYGAGILKSSDGGASWQHIPGPFADLLSPFQGTSAVGSLTIHPQDPKLILAGAYFPGVPTRSGVYRSTDGGLTWTSKPLLSGAPVIELFFDPQGSTAYASLGFRSGAVVNGVYKSIDAGQTWQTINGAFPNEIPSGVLVGRLELTPDLNDPTGRTLYAGISSSVLSEPLRGIYKTIDGGENWQLISTFSYCTPQCWYNNVLRVHPTDARVLIAGGVVLYRSMDGGMTWQNLPTYHADTHALAFSSGAVPKIYIGNDGGAWSNRDVRLDTLPYTNLNHTLAITQFYGGPSIHPVDPNYGFAGTQDNGLERYLGDLLWDGVACGDGGWSAIDFNTPTTVYGTCQQIAILKSTASGGYGSWSSRQSGVEPTDRVQWTAPLVMDPSDPLRLYFGTFRVYQTLTGAEGNGAWRAISGELTPGTLTAIAVSSSDPNVVYAGGNIGRVVGTTNALSAPDAVTWRVLTDGLPSLRTVSQIAIDRESPQVAYVAFSGYSGFFGDDLGHVFKTVNWGEYWFDISGDFPNVPVTDLTIDDSRPGTLYLATDVGVFATVDDGIHWFPLGFGLPRVPVLGLKLHPSGILRAVTHGRSAWDLQIGEALAD